MLERFLIVGLGNPGARYQRTRHNAGFMVVERLGAEYHAVFVRKKIFAEQSEIVVEGRRVILAKPLTYMNNSGEAVAALVHKLKIPMSSLLVVIDDIDLPFGRIRLRSKGGSGGHKGLASIIQHLGTGEFARLRLGIGGEGIKGDVVRSVLSPFRRREREELQEILALAVEAVLCFIREGIEKAMNSYNTK